VAKVLRNRVGHLTISFSFLKRIPVKNVADISIFKSKNRN